MKLSHFIDSVIPDAMRLVADPKNIKSVKQKAVAMIGDQTIVDEDGNEIDIEAIQLIPAGAKAEGDPDPELDENGNPKGKMDDEDDTDEQLARKVAVLVGGQLKTLTSTLGKVADDVKAVKAHSITGGENRNDDQKRFGFKTFGEQLRAIADYYRTGGRTSDERLHVKAPLGLEVSTPSEGGFLLAPAFSDRIMEIGHEANPLIDMTDSFDINGPSIKVNAIDETSRATGSRRGGVRGYWLAEADSVTSSKPKFRQIELSPHKLGVLVYATEEMIEDGGAALQQLVERGAAEEINFLTGDSIINGNGAGKPLGILNAPCLISQAKETNQDADTIVHENIVNMWSRLHVSARNNAAWFINQECEPQLHTMSLAVGTGGVPTYLPPGGLSDKPYGSLFGRPVIPTEFNAALGDQGDIILGDMKHYLSATRGGIKSAVSMHVQFLTDELAYRFLFKVDGQPWWNSALTPYKGAATQGPFVTLAARA